MSPTMSADQVAAFYRDPATCREIRYSMILFNWFGVGLIPILALIVMQIRGWPIARRSSPTPAGLPAGGPTLFLIANVFWLLAAFRPERSPELTQLLNDLALDHLHRSGPLFDRAMRAPGSGDLFRRSARPVFNRGWHTSIFWSRPRWYPPHSPACR